jgi:uncharacterized protein YciI
MASFAVMLAHGLGWDPSPQIRVQEGWDEHAAFMDGLAGSGFIILGGPVGDGEETLRVVGAADEDGVRARLAADPWARAGLLRIAAIGPGRSGSTAADGIRLTDQQHGLTCARNLTTRAPCGS